MRILNLIPSLSGGGAERQLGYLVLELVRNGHEVHIAYSREGPQKPQIPGVILHNLKSRSNYDPQLIVQLTRIIRSVKPDIIHSWILQMDILGGILSRINRIPWVLREPASSKAYPPSWKNRLRVMIGSYAGAIVSNSQEGDHYWKRQLPNSRRFIVANALQVEEINKVEAAYPTDVRNSEKPVVLFAGRLVSDSSTNKNLRNFLESFVYVKKEKKIVGIICGAGPLRQELTMLTKELELEGDIHFLGHLPVIEVWALMKKAAVFVSLSAHEGCPNAVMEAMVCGCPLVLSDIPAHREILDEQSALFVDPANIRQTAETIVQVLSNKEEARKRAWFAKQKTFNWLILNMANNYERIYQTLIFGNFRSLSKNS